MNKAKVIKCPCNNCDKYLVPPLINCQCGSLSKEYADMVAEAYNTYQANKAQEVLWTKDFNRLVKKLPKSVVAKRSGEIVDLFFCSKKASVRARRFRGKLVIICHDIAATKQYYPEITR